MADQLPTGSDGCASLDGLPANQAWTFQWEPYATMSRGRGRSVHQMAAGSTLPLECGGFAFVFLPLDPVLELVQRGMGDGSVWPESLGSASF